MASSAPTTNGASHRQAEGQAVDLSQVIPALEAVYDPRSSNDVRQAASSYLESVKKLPEAPGYGFRTAVDKSQPAALRHYGLSILESVIRYGWEDCTDGQTSALREYVVQLARSVDEGDPLYLRNKVAQLWIDVVKRAWGTEWMDMDAILVSLWESSVAKKLLVLYVLETLSEEIFTRDDFTSSLHGVDIGSACFEIFTPAAVLAEKFPERSSDEHLRFGKEGWIRRLCDLLEWCLTVDFEKDENVQLCAVKTLHALRPLMGWIMITAVTETHCIETVCKALVARDLTMQMAAVEALLALYNRPTLTNRDFVAAVCQMYTQASVSTLRDLYSWSCTDINNLQDQKYNLCKKLSELLSTLASLLEQRPELVPDDNDLPAFYNLLFGVLQNDSLVVSIPVLHSWARLLRHPYIRDSESVSRMIGRLLETCSQRLVRYEALPEDTKNATILYLNEDIDTIPERHAFLGNYRRYCVDVVEVIVRKMPIEAMHHILNQAKSLFQTLYDGEPPFQPSTFAKYSIPGLRVDAQVTVIDAALKGYLKWVSCLGDNPQQNERERIGMQNFLEQWCLGIMIDFGDPDIRKKIIQMMVSFSVKALNTRPAFAVSVLEYIFSTPSHSEPNSHHYAEAMRNLQQSCTVESQKLAMVFSDHFLTIYDDLERKINQLVRDDLSDDRQRHGYMAFLFIIVHRASEIDQATRMARLESMVKPVVEAWQNSHLADSLSSFHSFCEMLGFGQLFDYLSSHRFGQVSDWSSQSIDAEGQAMQSTILSRVQSLPLRMTKSLLAASTEKVREDTRPYETTCELWAGALPSILPNLLQLISHAQAFNNMDNWSHLSPELQAVMKRILTDRFWQAGISGESREEFYARVGGTRTTFDGFASTVRGAVRQIRETSYYILYSMSKLQHRFYGISDLPMPLAQALFRNAHALSAHHLSVLLSMAAPLIEGCPVADRNHFLPPMITSLFSQLNTRIASEWEAIRRKSSQAAEGDDLSDEMKTESILRQLSFSAVTLVASLLDDGRQHGAERRSEEPKEETMRGFMLSNQAITESLIMFCRNAIGFHDTRCCALIIRVLRMTISHFEAGTPARDFISCDMLQASITSLHDPYFTDLHKDLAGIIAYIIRLDRSGVARSVILSLPGLSSREEKVNRVIKSIMETHSERQQRALVLDLLSSVRGVSIHEQGKIRVAEPRKARPSIQEQYMNVDEPPRIARGGSPELAGVSDMFG